MLTGGDPNTGFVTRPAFVTLRRELVAAQRLPPAMVRGVAIASA
jgi:hypothetical protein